MKKILYVVYLLLIVYYAGAQNVGINIDNTPPTDPKAMLEIKKSAYSKLKIRTTSFLTDTAVLELSNRSTGGNGTDFLFSHIRENALVLSSRSDLSANTRDSIMTVTPGGAVRFRALRGTGTRQVTADENGEISTSVLAPGTYYLSIPHVAFQPRFNNSTTNFTASDLNAMASFSAGSNNYLVAAVNLPQGAVVTSFKAYFVDNSTEDILFDLGRTGPTLFGTATMATFTSSGASGSSTTMSNLEDVTITGATVDNNNFMYYILAGPPGGCCWDASNLRIKGVVIKYTL